MLRNFAITGALAAGLAFSPAAVTSASAAPLTKSPFAASVTDNLILARQDGGGRGFSGGGGGGRSFGGGGGGRAFSGGGGGGRAFRGSGGGMRAFSGSNRSFNRGSMGASRSFSRNRQAFTGGNLRRGNNWNGGKNWGGGRGHRHHRRFYGGGYGYYPSYGASYYSYDSGYSDCGWLLRRAEDTGSSYWYRRYEDCVSGY